jgi:hypothetical protein
MASTSESTRRGLHNRYHVRKGILKADCALCQLASQAAGNTIMPATPPKPTTAMQAEVRLEISSKLTSEDAAMKVRGVAARKRTIEEAAMVFGMTTEEFAEEFRKGYPITWEQYSERAAVIQLDEVEAAIYRAAKDGDIRFVQLLLITGRLTGWVAGDEIPMRRLPGAAYEIGTTEAIDLRAMTIEELESKRKKLLSVIDRPSVADRINGLQIPTLKIEDTTDVPSGWARASDGKIVVEDSLDAYEKVLTESMVVGKQ